MGNTTAETTGFGETFNSALGTDSGAGYAILEPLLLLTIAGCVGLAIAYLIWPNGPAKRPSDTARQFLASTVSSVTMSVGGWQLIKYGFNFESISTTIPLIIFYSIIGGTVGWLYGYFIRDYPAGSGSAGTDKTVMNELIAAQASPVAFEKFRIDDPPHIAASPSSASRSSIRSMTDTDNRLVSIVVPFRRTISNELYRASSARTNDEILLFAISAVGTFVRFYGWDKVASQPAQEEADRFLKAATARYASQLGISEEALLRKLRDRFTEYNVLIEENFRNLADGMSGGRLLNALDRHVVGSASELQMIRATALENILTHTAEETKHLLEKARHQRAMKQDVPEPSLREDSESHAEQSPPRAVAAQAASGARISAVSSEAWSVAVDYHPEIKGHYESLKVLDSDLAERFRANVLEDRDFQSASSRFFESIAEATMKIDGDANPEAYFLAKKLAENGELDALAELLKINRLIGFSGDWEAFQDKFSAKNDLRSELLWDAEKAQGEAEAERLARKEREQREKDEWTERQSDFRAARQERLVREEREEIEYERRETAALAEQNVNEGAERRKLSDVYLGPIGGPHEALLIYISTIVVGLVLWFLWHTLSL